MSTETITALIAFFLYYSIESYLTSNRHDTRQTIDLYEENKETFMGDTHRGSCLCGETSFEVKGKIESFFLCHCKHCQKDTGSAHGANLFSTQATLNWISGDHLVTKFQLANTRHCKSFCKKCGSALPFLQMEGKLVVIPAGSLDTPLDLRPNAHLFNSSRALWDNHLGDLKQFDKLPE